MAAKSKRVSHGNAKKHMNLHTEGSSHAMNIYDAAACSKGGNHLTQESGADGGGFVDIAAGGGGNTGYGRKR